MDDRGCGWNVRLPTLLPLVSIAFISQTDPRLSYRVFLFFQFFYFSVEIMPPFIRKPRKTLIIDLLFYVIVVNESIHSQFNSNYQFIHYFFLLLLIYLFIILYYYY